MTQEKKGWLQRLTTGLSRSSRQMSETVVASFVKQPLDQARLDDLEEMLIEADLGPHSAARITARFPSVHGAPIHIGDPAAIGIADLGAPDYGDPVEIEPGETPVFWACGVTPQAALQAAGVDFCITHAPGCMLVTDRLNAEFAAL